MCSTDAYCLSLQKSAAGAEEAAAVDGSAAATNGAMEIDAPSTSAEPAVNGAATAEKKKKKKKRTAEEAALEVAPAEDGAAAEEAPKPKKKKDKAAANGVADAPTTEKKVQQPFPHRCLSVMITSLHLWCMCWGSEIQQCVCHTCLVMHMYNPDNCRYDADKQLRACRRRRRNQRLEQEDASRVET